MPFGDPEFSSRFFFTCPQRLVIKVGGFSSSTAGQIPSLGDFFEGKFV